MYDDVICYFEVPPEAVNYVADFLCPDEIEAIQRMRRDVFAPEALETLLQPIADDPAAFVKDMYARGVLNKVDEEEKTGFQAANFYRRLAYFTQYEPEAWKAIPESDRIQMDAWYVREYAEGARPRLEEALRDPDKNIENAYFVTLEEAFDIVDALEDDPYMVPCNCKAVALHCADKKPQNVCLLFAKGPNSEWDRGHGQPLSKEEAKDLLRHANKNGLMQTSECEEAICNCCGCCCYPIRGAQLIGARGLWPRKRFRVERNEETCTQCGKCARICNFGAFEKVGKEVRFDESKCWGCSICAGNCPANAISLIRL